MTRCCSSRSPKHSLGNRHGLGAEDARELPETVGDVGGGPWSALQRGCEVVGGVGEPDRAQLRDLLVEGESEREQSRAGSEVSSQGSTA